MRCDLEDSLKKNSDYNLKNSDYNNLKTRILEISEIIEGNARIVEYKNDSLLLSLQKDFGYNDSFKEFSTGISDFQEISDISEKIKRFKDLNNSLEKFKEKIKTVDYNKKKHLNLHKKIKQYRKKLEYYENEFNNLTEWFLEYEKYERYISLLSTVNYKKERYENYVKRVINLETLNRNIKSSEVLAISNFIDMLNSYASIYVENFFPNDDLSVDLKIKSVDNKSSLNFEINYKDIIDGDLSLLSGGETARVNLAYTLALAQLCKNKILMLDECISSLDSISCQTVLDCLKENYKGLILMVSHQITCGGFDHILDI